MHPFSLSLGIVYDDILALSALSLSLNNPLGYCKSFDVNCYIKIPHHLRLFHLFAFKVPLCKSIHVLDADLYIEWQMIL